MGNMFPVILIFLSFFLAAPMAVPRTTMEDIQVDGLTISKGCTLVEVIMSAHLDTDYWENPEEFRPERFLDDNGAIIRHEAFIAFGLGV
jgi:cytochrome P450